MCTYEDLVAATLPLGLAPLVVPQLKTITVGGAATGGGIESTSFRSGLVFDDIVELDVLTGAGEIVTATPDNEHADLYFGFPNSYGTLGYATRLRVRLEPIKPFVALRHLRFSRVEDLEAAIAAIVADRQHDGIAVDYLDGVVFTESESYLTLGTLTDEPGPTSDYTGQQIYYRSIQQRDHRSVDHPRLPVALGHRLVLVFAGIRRPAAPGPPAVAEAPAAQLRLLETGRAGPPVRHRRPAGTPASPAAAGAGGAGHRGSAGPDRGVRELVHGHDSHRAGLALPAATAGDPRQDGPRPGRCTRSRPEKTYVNVGFWSAVPTAPGRAGRRDQPADRAEGHRTGRTQVAVLRRLLQPGTFCATSTAA